MDSTHPNKRKNLFNMLNLNNQIKFKEHRSGWEYALNALAPLHSDNGMLFDGFIEKNFAWNYPNAKNNKIIPYTKEWIGFIHNPPLIAEWYKQEQNKPANFLRTKEAVQSLKHCKALFTLSDYLKDYLIDYLNPDFPIITVYHPTETPDLKFTVERFEANRQKKLIQLGFWLRYLTSIYKINTNKYTKTMLLARADITKSYLPMEIQHIKKTTGFNTLKHNNIKYINHVSNDNYDRLLSENIAFMHLLDTSCNNAVIECIVRNTPLVINKHPATIEYLGKDYPLYFEDLSQVDSLLEDDSLIIQAHEYLTKLDKTFLSAEHFKESVENNIKQLIL